MSTAKLESEALDLITNVQAHISKIRGALAAVKSGKIGYDRNELSPLLFYARMNAIWAELNNEWQDLLGTTGNVLDDYDPTVLVYGADHALTLVNGASSKELTIEIGTIAVVISAALIYFGVGDIIILAGLPNAADDGYYTVSSLSGTSTLTVVLSETGAWGTAGACGDGASIRHSIKA